MKMNFKYILLVGIVMLSINICSIAQQSGQEDPSLKLWYDVPAERWMTQVLPVGNGIMGAMVFGGIDKEHIQFNESSLWSGALPANLQGVWNNQNAPSWDSDYHTDINLEMNYWLAGPTNLLECFAPLVDYVGFLRVPGGRAAEKYFNTKGFYVNIYTNPLGYAELKWLWTGASGWLCQNLYDSFLYSGDMNYLRNKIYPIMREASLFYLDILKPYYKNNKLVVTPSISPETGFYFTDGNIYRVCAGASVDQQIVFDLFTNTIEAVRLLKVDTGFIKQLSEALNNLSPPIIINKSGDLQEWIEDWNAQFMEHRHLSHLYALYPGRMISPMMTSD